MGAISVIFKEEMSRHTFNLTARTFTRILLLAAAVGLLTWLLAIALDKYMLTPMFCGRDEGLSTCLNSTVMGANIAAVLTGILAVPLIVVLRVKRALLVVIASVVVLWNVAAWTSGAWYLSLLWAVAAYITVYASLVWINRLRGDFLAILLIIVFAIAARVVLSGA